MIECIISYFKVTAVDSRGTNTEFHFPNSCHAESVLRGLVHSSYAVTICECRDVKKCTDAEIAEYERNGYGICIIRGDEPCKSYGGQLAMNPVSAQNGGY